MIISRTYRPWSELYHKTRRCWVKACGMAIEVTPARAYDRDRRDIVTIYGVNSRNQISEALEIKARPEDMDAIARAWMEHRENRGDLTEITLEQALEQSYVAKKGMVCLYCSSDQIQANTSDSQEDCIYTEVICNTCGKVWTDIFTLTGVLV